MSRYSENAKKTSFALHIYNEKEIASVNSALLKGGIIQSHPEPHVKLPRMLGLGDSGWPLVTQACLGWL